MNDYYLGYVEFIHQNPWGRIRPLAVITERSSDGSWVVNRACVPGEFGKTGLVYWRRIPSDQFHLAHSYVRFKVEPNTGTRTPGRDGDFDEYVVAEERRNGTMHRVRPLGLPILQEDDVRGPERLVDANSGRPLEMIVYRRRLKDTMIDGPWRVAAFDATGRLCLRPKEDDHVVEHAFWLLGQETYHDWKTNEGEDRAVLLVEPAKAGGKVIDLLPASGLADWLVRVLKGDKPLLSKLDVACPGWRGQVGGLLGAEVDPLQRGRFGRLELALDALAADEARLSDLVESSRFKKILDDAIGREVATSRERIEAAAREETRGFVAQQRQEREQAKALAEREKKALLREVDKVRAEVADAESLRAEARAKVEQDESSIRIAADYLVESRERIIHDFSAFHGLIENARARGNGMANGHDPAVAKVLEAPTPERTGVEPQGPLIDDSDIFLDDRLTPALAAWGAEATRLQAKRLHAALLVCQWVAAPCPSWGVAYAEAIGASARHQIVAVEPTWLAFSDAWGGEVEAFWSEADERCDALHLLIFADADRALVQCWARPLLDIVSGLRRALPSGLRWPKNLRVISCPSADEAALPVPDWVVAHWAGVKATSGGTCPEGPIAPGHVTFAAWSGWIMTPEDAPPLSDGLGVAARSAARERSALARVFRQLEPNGDPQNAEKDASEVREVDARSVFSKKARV